MNVNVTLTSDEYRLLKAAPDLLDALQEFMSLIDAFGPNSDLGRHVGIERVRKARAALSKATGEQP